MLAFIALVVFFSGLTFTSSTPLPPAVKSFPTVISNCTVMGQVALTFDDGPYAYDSTISKYLGNNTGTFFLNAFLQGNNYACIYDYADDIINLYQANHILGSHTWSHANLTCLSPAEIHAELSQLEDAFSKILGIRPLYFRPPYGEIDNTTLAVLAERGYSKVFLWSDDTNDSDGADVWQSVAVYDASSRSYPAPHIILEHSPDQLTADELVPYAISELTVAGYDLVGVNSCLGSPHESPYVYVGEPQPRDATWHC